MKMKNLTLLLMLLLVLSFTFISSEASALEEYHHFMWENMYQTSEIEYQPKEGYIEFGIRPMYLEGFNWAIDNFGDTKATLGAEYGMDENLVVGGNMFTSTRRWYDSSGDLIDTEQYFTGALEGKYKVIENEDMSFSTIAGGQFSSSEYDDAIMPYVKGIMDYNLKQNIVLTNSIAAEYSLSNNNLHTNLENSVKYVIDEANKIKASSDMNLNNLNFSERDHSLKAAYRRTINEEVDYIGYIQTNDLGSSGFFNSINNAVVFSPEHIPELELSSWFKLSPGGFNTLELASGYRINNNLTINGKMYQDITNNRTGILTTIKYMF